MRSWAPADPRRIFLDTAAHYALADPRDGNYPVALRIRDRLIAQRGRLFTTNFVLAETHALLLGRRGPVVAWRTLQEIEHSSLTIVRVSSGDERRAREILAQYDDKAYSLTDATSFAVIDRLGMTHAFTFDHSPAARPLRPARR